jgi:hypothetical protein
MACWIYSLSCEKAASLLAVFPKEGTKGISADITSYDLVSKLFVGVLCPLLSLDFRLTITEGPGVLRNGLRQAADDGVETVEKGGLDL